MVTYQKISNSTGDQDLCYYNYLCAHPFGLLSDFNHVYSNLGYIMLGVLFMVIVFFKERQYNRQKRPNAFESGNVQLLNEPHYGVPQYFGKCLLTNVNDVYTYLEFDTFLNQRQSKKHLLNRK